MTRRAGITSLSNRERFLRACRCRAVDRPPVWLMRQAGRCLPEYRALKTRHSFLELAQTPELAAEVTLQPVRRFGFDAAILFSDILVVPEAMGQAYRFRDGGGIEMEGRLRTAADIARLKVEGVAERLDYVARALRLIRRELGDRTALIGFGGSPWTLANFMLEGGSAREFTAARRLALADPQLFDRLLGKLSAALVEYFRMQIRAGVDAIQIFDTLGGLLAPNDFARHSARWLGRIIRSLKSSVPVIVFARGVHEQWATLASTGADAFGVDWTVPLVTARRGLGARFAVQGNLDPLVLTTTPAVTKRETRRILEEMRGRRGHIFNLGHGVPPEARLDCLEALVAAVHTFR